MEIGEKTDPDCCELAGQLKALGHPVRLEIIRYLASCEGRCCGEVCECLPLAQSTVSQHLDILKKANLILSEQDGNRSRFSLNRKALQSLVSEIEFLTPHNNSLTGLES